MEFGVPRQSCNDAVEQGKEYSEEKGVRNFCF